MNCPLCNREVEIKFGECGNQQGWMIGCGFKEGWNKDCPNLIFRSKFYSSKKMAEVMFNEAQYELQLKHFPDKKAKELELCGVCGGKRGLCLCLEGTPKKVKVNGL
jgi:hypothetical protein